MASSNTIFSCITLSDILHKDFQVDTCKCKKVVRRKQEGFKGYGIRAIWTGTLASSAYHIVRYLTKKHLWLQDTQAFTIKCTEHTMS